MKYHSSPLAVQPSQHKTQHSKHLAPKKELGQNFLHDPNIARNIVSALNIQPGEIIVEIGPGEGALTALLLETPAAALTAIEYDKRAVELLQVKFSLKIHSVFPVFSIICADVRRTGLRSIVSDAQAAIHQRFSTATEFGSIPANNSSDDSSHVLRIKVIGNIPYYITSDILFWMFDEWAQFLTEDSSNNSPANSVGLHQPRRLESAVIMMQKEVAERIVAKPRTKEYGVLSVATRLAATPKLLFHVSPHCFFPKPSVTSSVVEFRFHQDSALQAEQYRRTQPLVRMAFNQRRKMLSNALSGVLTQSKTMTTHDILQRAHNEGLRYFQQRAEELTTNDFITLTEFLRDCGCYAL